MSNLSKLLSETIHEDLEKTFEAMVNGEELPVNKEEDDDALRKEEEEKEGEKEIKEEEKKEEESTSDGVKKDEPPEDEEESEEEEEEEESEASLEAGDLEPNSGWDKDTQEGFRQLPENMQEFMLKRYGEMHADYTRKTKDVADIKRALEPVRDEIKELGVSDGVAVNNLVSAHRMLKQHPLKGIQYLMMAYDITLDDVQENWQDPEAFARTAKENSRLNRIESELNAGKLAEVEKQHDLQVAEIEAFKKTHPHYNEAVEKEMTNLARAAFIAKEPKPTLESLYNRAIWMVPEIRDKILAEKKKGDTKSGKDVKEAKKAATRIKATVKKEEKESEKPKTLRGDLSAEWDKAASA